MYSKNNSRDVAVLKKVAEQNRNARGRVLWLQCVNELNKVFSENSSTDVWSKRFERLSVPFVTKKEVLEQVRPESKKEMLISLLASTRNLGELMAKTNLNKYEVLGLMREVEAEGVYKIKEAVTKGEFAFTLERALVPEKTQYNHSIGESKTFTFMVISDSHMGSKNEQVTFLHYLYDLAEERGISNVYHCGDISEGFKKSRDDHIYSLHAISFDDQADHIIRNYPERDGITTYFITGNHDHFHIQNGGANIGKRISASRSDMKYLGINTAVVNLTENCKMELFHPQDGSSYAMSYSGQKYLDSLSGGDKPHMLFVGHHHKYISMWYRNVWYFEVPSTHLQSDWEKGKRIRNDSGALIVTVTVDEDGTLLDCNHSMIPHIKHIKNDWMQYAVKE